MIWVFIWVRAKRRIRRQKCVVTIIFFRKTNKLKPNLLNTCCTNCVTSISLPGATLTSVVVGSCHCSAPVNTFRLKKNIRAVAVRHQRGGV